MSILQNLSSPKQDGLDVFVHFVFAVFSLGCSTERLRVYDSIASDDVASNSIQANCGLGTGGGYQTDLLRCETFSNSWIVTNSPGAPSICYQVLGKCLFASQTGFGTGIGNILKLYQFVPSG